MNARERFIKTMNFEKPDRMPMMEWASWWDKTIERWKGEGLVIEPFEGISEGDALGLVLFVGSEGDALPGDTEYKLAQTIAGFIGRHMEG